MNTLDFVSLAVSTDKTRHNLTGVYRDTNKLVATDGHRMHWVNSLPDATPSYLDGRKDSQFPDISQVMPTGAPACVCEFNLTLEAIKIIKGIASVVKTYDRNQAVILEVGVATLFLQADKRDELKCCYSIPCDTKAGTIKVGLSLRYLLDAMAPVIENKGKGTVLIEFYGKTAPILITCIAAAQTYKAIVMPYRL